MSTKLALSLAGGAMGLAIGYPGIGFAAGSILGNLLSRPNAITQEGPRLSDLDIQSSSYGQTIPIHFGRNRLTGQVIWALPIREARTQATSGGGKGSPEIIQVNYSYYGTFAVAFCRGAVSSFGRIWLDSTLFYDATPSATPTSLYAARVQVANLRFYLGNDVQMPDVQIEAQQGIGNTPAYRGLAYIVFEDLSLASYGNRLPQVTVEVIAHGSQQQGKRFVVTGDYQYGVVSNTGFAYHVFTKIDSGVLRILHWGLDQVRLLSSDGKFLGMSPRDAAKDVYWGQTTCGQLNGQALFLQFNYRNNPFNDNNPPQIYVLDDDNKTGLNILDFDIPGTHYLLGFAVTADSQRAMVITGFRQTSPVRFLPQLWFLIYLYEGQVVVQTQGSALGLQITNVPLGNRAGVGTVGINGRGFDAMCLENDWRYLWYASTSNPKEVSCYQVTSTGMQLLYRGDTSSTLSPPTCIADKGMCWTAYNRNTDVYTRNEVVDSETMTLAEVIVRLCDLAGLEAQLIDVSRLSALIIGFTLTQSSSARAAIETLCQAHFIDVAEVDGQLRFLPRGQNPTVTLPESELSVQEIGSQSEETTAIIRQAADNLPQRVSVAYIHDKADYQRGLQTVTRLPVVNTQVFTLELPLVLSDREAAQIADVYLQTLWLSRTTIRLQVGMRYLLLSPGDVIALARKGTLFNWRIVSMEMGRPGIIQLQAVAESASRYDSVVEGGDISIPPQQINFPSPTLLQVLDIPTLVTQDNHTGFYMAACGYGADWPGAVILQSSDGMAFNPLATLFDCATIGTSLRGLGNSEPWLMDDKNTLTVQLFSGALETITHAQLLQGDNLACVGSELIQFQEAVLNNNGDMVLSALVRGRLGTEHEINQHQTVEPFVLLNRNVLERVQVDNSIIGQSQILKAVTLGMLAGEAIGDKFCFKAKGLMPFAPVHITSMRSTNYSLTLTWKRRNRIDGQWRDLVGVPMSEFEEVYEVDIIRNAQVVRTFSDVRPNSSNTPNPRIIYYASEQSADGFTPGQPIEVAVYQLSAVVGRGFPGRAVV